MINDNFNMEEIIPMFDVKDSTRTSFYPIKIPKEACSITSSINHTTIADAEYTIKTPLTIFESLYRIKHSYQGYDELAVHERWVLGRFICRRLHIHENNDLQINGLTHLNVARNYFPSAININPLYDHPIGAESEDIVLSGDFVINEEGERFVMYFNNTDYPKEKLWKLS